MYLSALFASVIVVGIEWYGEGSEVTCCWWVFGVLDAAGWDQKRVSRESEAADTSVASQSCCGWAWDSLSRGVDCDIATVCADIDGEVSA